MNNLAVILQNGFVLILLVAIPAGAIMLWRQKRSAPKREQNSLLITEDLRIVPIALPVELGYIVSHKWSQAWLIDPGIIIRQRGTTVNYSILDERDAAPQPLTPRAAERRQKFDQEKSGDENLSEIDRIGRQRGAESVTQVVTHQEKQKQAELLKTIALTLLGTFVLMVLALIAAERFGGG